MERSTTSTINYMPNNDNNPIGTYNPNYGGIPGYSSPSGPGTQGVTTPFPGGVPMLNTNTLTQNGTQPVLPPAPQPVIPTQQGLTQPLAQPVTSPVVPAPDLTTNSGILKRYIELSNQLQGKDITDLNAQITAKNDAFKTAEGDVGNGTYGSGAQNARITALGRQQSIEIGNLSSELANKVKPIQDQLDSLVKFQQMNNNDLTDSQKIRLQGQIELSNYKAKAAYDAAKADAGIFSLPTTPLSYTIKSTDIGNYALTKIAQGLGTDVATLMSLNPQINANGDNLRTGDVLKLPNSNVSVSQLPDGTYSTADQQAILARMSPQDRSIVQEVGNYQMDLAKVTSLTKGQREALAAKVALVYPGFQMSQYAANAAYRKGLAGTTANSAGGIINSANKMMNHLTDFADATSKLGNGTVSSKANPIGQGIKSIFSQNFQNNEAQSKLAAVGVTDELAKFFKGTAADAQTIKSWEKRINPASTPAQLHGTVQAAIDLMQGQLNPMIDQYRQTLGSNPPEGLFLKPDTIQNLSNLKNQGYKVDIPGVYYTDKSAWEKYGGGNESALNNAYNMLIQNGLPPTPENILQAAQL